ncbi:acyl-CoA thioester hydrolase YciA [Zophobihabitans entericus]|mgnify:CR=1 FL=1|uniref:Acyl-CoA thioester hydrolase YciA n=1 Tax=Zophobihabitans entericus TaxID=1635327 RepID=A0A6G9ICP9_9GAMM|nr:acyl-CoA thioester hydrolase YciA [Zophobihabitans entericus]QIQ21617.1 acyl-CoA thioester hydrolase YciA [Zophobihabitans entericus]
MSAEEKSTPKGELVLRTLAMPADSNPYGHIFGGWIMSQMDLGGAILAKEVAKGRVVTVNVSSITFLKPALIGDVVCCYARVLKTGRTSLTIAIEVWVKKVTDYTRIGERFCITEAEFTYVSVDKHFNPKPLPELHQNFDAKTNDVSILRSGC